MLYRVLLILLLSLPMLPVRPQVNGIIVVTDAGHRLTDFTVSTDGKYLLTWCSSSVALWNLQTMQTIRVLPISLKSARFGPGNPLVVYVNTGMDQWEGYHMLTGEFMGVKSGDELMWQKKKSDRYIFDKDSENGTILVKDCNSEQLLYTLACNTMPSLGRIDITSNDSLLLLTGMQPQIWNLKRARLETKLPFSNYVLSRDTALTFAFRQVPVKKAQLKTFIQNSYSKSNCKGCFTPDGKVLLGGYDDISTWTEAGQVIASQQVEGWPVYDWCDYKGLRYIVTNSNGLVAGGMDDKQLKAVGSPHPLFFISQVMGDGTTFFSSMSNYVMRGNISYPDIVYKSHWIATFVNSDISPDGNKMLLCGELGNIKEMDCGTNNVMRKYDSNSVFNRSRVNAARYLQDGQMVVAGCTDGVVALWSSGNEFPVWSTKAHRGQVSDVMPTHAGSRFVTCGTDGWTRIYDWKQRSEVMAMYSKEGTGDYLFLTNDNYYKGTKGVFSDIHFSKGTDTYDFDQFDLVSNRPDIILQRLGGSPMEIDAAHQAWLKRIRRMGFDPAQLSTELHVPEGSIANATQLPAATNHPIVTLKLAAIDSQYRLKRLMLYLNGVPLLGRHGMDILGKATQQYNMNYDLTLASGRNDITFSCINEKGVESYRKHVSITYTPDGQPVQPDLYIVSIGVSKYKQPDFDLTFASKDAKDFVQLMETSQNGRFAQVHTLCLTDSDVVDVCIREQVSALLRQSHRDDVVMLYYAGHGLLDEHLDYYLSTHNTNFEQPSQGSLPFEQIEDWLDGTQALRRCCFIDACHSGELDKDDLLAESKVSLPEGNITFRNAAATQRQIRTGVRQLNALVEDLFVDTRWGVGATILASAGGMEAAIEGDDWQNGLFTWCLKRAMACNDADANHDGQITISELTQYLRSEVSRLSDGRQQPVLRSGKSIMNEYVIR